MKNKADLDINYYLKVGYKIATFYRGNGVAYEELKSVIHEAVAEAYNNYDEEKNVDFIAYVIKASRSKLIRTIEMTHAKKRVILDYASTNEPLMENLQTKEPSTLDMLVQKEEADLLFKYLNKLPKRWRYILRRRYLKPNIVQSNRYSTVHKGTYDSSYRIGKQLGISATRVQQIEKQAIERLKTLIKEGTKCQS